MHSSCVLHLIDPLNRQTDTHQSSKQKQHRNTNTNRSSPSPEPKHQAIAIMKDQGHEILFGGKPDHNRQAWVRPKKSKGKNKGSSSSASQSEKKRPEMGQQRSRMEDLAEAGLAFPQEGARRRHPGATPAVGQPPRSQQAYSTQSSHNPMAAGSHRQPSAFESSRPLHPGQRSVFETSRPLRPGQRSVFESSHQPRHPSSQLPAFSHASRASGSNSGSLARSQNSFQDPNVQSDSRRERGSKFTPE